MTENEIVLKAGTKVFIGSLSFTLQEAVLVAAGALTSRDQLAEALAAGSQVAYAEHRDELAYELVRPHVFAEGEEPRKAVIAVTYGVGGARREDLVGEFDAVLAARRAEVEPKGVIEHTGDEGAGPGQNPGNGEPGN